MAEAAKIMQAKTSRLPVRHSQEYGRPRPVDRLRTEVDRLLNDFLRGYWHVPFRSAAIDMEPYWRGEISFGATPPVDIVDTDDAYKLTAELPGVQDHDVEIKFSQGTLTIEGQKQEEMQDRAQEHFLAERRFAAFYRSFRVPNGVDTDKIGASLKNGILTVMLPKTPEARKKQKKVAVKGA